MTFHAPIDPHQFARKEELLAAVRAAIDSALPEPTAIRLRPNLPLTDAHPGADLEGDFRGTLRAEIIRSGILLSRLILKLDAEFAGRSDRRHVPMRLLIAKFGQAKGSGRMLHLKILQGMSGVVHNVDVHHGLRVVASRSSQHHDREAGKNYLSSSFILTFYSGRMTRQAPGSAPHFFSISRALSTTPSRPSCSLIGKTSTFHCQ